MKHILTLSAIIFLFSCTGKPGQTVAAKPTIDTVQEWHCVPIAPLPELKRAVGMRGKFWPVGATIKIGFIGGTEAQKNTVKQGFANWKQSANLNFTYPTTGPYDIRISFNPGSAWSYIGVDAKQISQNSPTLNLGFGGANVIEREVAHSLGMLVEQQIAGGICWNEANVIADLSGSPIFWSEAQIRFNVLTPHNPANVILGVYDNK